MCFYVVDMVGTNPNVHLLEMHPGRKNCFNLPSSVLPALETKVERTHVF